MNEICGEIWTEVKQQLDKNSKELITNTMKSTTACIVKS